MKTIYRLTIILGLLCSVIIIGFFIYHSNIFSTKEVKIPYVSDKSLNEATVSLSDANLEYEIVYIIGDEERVLYTIPYEGTNVKVNTKVLLYYSCIEKEGIPDLLYIEITKAKSILDEKNIQYECTYVEDDNYEENIVIKQEIISDNNVLLYVSKHKENDYLPSLVGLFEEQAIQILKTYNINFELKYEESLFPSGMVLYTDIPNNSIVGMNNQSQVTIVISK